MIKSDLVQILTPGSTHCSVFKGRYLSKYQSYALEIDRTAYPTPTLDNTSIQVIFQLQPDEVRGKMLLHLMHFYSPRMNFLV